MLIPVIGFFGGGGGVWFCIFFNAIESIFKRTAYFVVLKGFNYMYFSFEHVCACANTCTHMCAKVLVWRIVYKLYELVFFYHVGTRDLRQVIGVTVEQNLSAPVCFQFPDHILFSQLLKGKSNKL